MLDFHSHNILSFRAKVSKSSECSFPLLALPPWRAQPVLLLHRHEVLLLLVSVRTFKRLVGLVVQDDQISVGKKEILRKC